MAERPTTEELLAAYVDGVGELEVEERRRVERHIPALRDEQAATRDMLDQLRALPDQTPSVDWAAMERAIHAEVGDEVPKRSWWFRWRFALPAFALAGAAAIIFVVTRAEPDDVSPIVFVPNPAPQDKAPVFEQLGDRVTVYLDGTDLEITDTADLDDVDDALADLELDTDDAGDEASLGFLEPSDLAWIDDLDDDALDRAEQALARPIKLRKGS